MHFSRSPSKNCVTTCISVTKQQQSSVWLTWKKQTMFTYYVYNVLQALLRNKILKPVVLCCHYYPFCAFRIVSAQLWTDDALSGIRGHPGECGALTDGAPGSETVSGCAVGIVSFFFNELLIVCLLFYDYIVKLFVNKDCWEKKQKHAIK